MTITCNKTQYTKQYAEGLKKCDRLNDNDNNMQQNKVHKTLC